MCFILVIKLIASHNKLKARSGMAPVHCVHCRKMAGATRKSFDCPIFENVSDMKLDQLPTYQDIAKSILWRKIELKHQTGKDPSMTDICKDVAKRVI